MAAVEISPFQGIPAFNISTSPSSSLGERISTQFPRNSTLIGMVAIAAITTIILATTSFTTWSWPTFNADRIPMFAFGIPAWPALVIGAALVGYLAIKHLLKKDPLVEAFYQIAGGKDAFNSLPEMNLDSTQTLSTQVSSLCAKWDDLPFPAYRAKTADGGNVMIVKTLRPFDPSRDFSVFVSDLSPPPVKGIMAFVEKLCPYDRENNISNVSQSTCSKITSLFFSIFVVPLSPFLSTKYTELFSRKLGSSFTSMNGVEERTESYLYGWISTDMVNELVSQRN